MGKKKSCEVIVGNVGTVESDVSLNVALKSYREYVKISKNNGGRAGDEEVTLMCDGEIMKDYIPKSKTKEKYRE